MKIRKLAVQGFRGFNTVHEIELDEMLTLIYAPNSYGKTSISEALEWLLYGRTSKVEKGADSKEEYKDSYRNIHFPFEETPYVEAAFCDSFDKVDTVFRANLLENDVCERFANGMPVEDWELNNGADIFDAPRPFVLQHALKDLLIAPPAERFKRFASLLGFNELSNIQTMIDSFCTSTPIPAKVTNFMQDISNLIVRLEDQPSLKGIQRELDRPRPDLPKAYQEAITIGRQLLSSDTLAEESLLPELLILRETTIAKIFKGSIVPLKISDIDKHLETTEESSLHQLLSESFATEYLELATLAALQQIVALDTFYQFGLSQLHNTVATCPFCGCVLDEQAIEHIEQEAQQHALSAQSGRVLEARRESLMKRLPELREVFTRYYRRHFDRIESLLQTSDLIPQIESLLGQENVEYVLNVNSNYSGMATNAAGKKG